MADNATLVSISAYAEHYNLSRQTVYNLIEKNLLTLFDNSGEKLLQLEQKPPVQKYGEKRKRKIISESRS